MNVHGKCSTSQLCALRALVRGEKWAKENETYGCQLFNARTMPQFCVHISGCPTILSRVQSITNDSIQPFWDTSSGNGRCFRTNNSLDRFSKAVQGRGQKLAWWKANIIDRVRRKRIEHDVGWLHTLAHSTHAQNGGAHLSTAHHFIRECPPSAL